MSTTNHCERGMMMQIRTIDLTRGSIMKALLLFAVPLFISNLFQQLYNTADTMIVGNVLGDQSLAAIGSTSAVFELIIGFANGVGSGFGIVIACLWGANDREKLKKAVASSLILSLMLSAVLMIVSFVALKPLLILLKTPADILEEAYGYISIICMAVAITMLYNLGAALLRAIGDSITPLIVLLIASVLNIALDFLFMTRFSMGIAGAAVATVIAQGVCCIFCFWFILRRAKVLVPSRKDFSFDSALCRELLEQGFSMGFMLSIVSLGTVALQSSINVLGTQIIAAHTTARKLFGLLTMPFATVAAAIATFTSQNKGAEQYDRIRQGVYQANMLTTIYSIVVTILIFLSAPFLVHVMSGSSDPFILQTGSMYMRINSPFLSYWAYCLICETLFREWDARSFHCSPALLNWSERSSLLHCSSHLWGILVYASVSRLSGAVWHCSCGFPSTAAKKSGQSNNSLPQKILYWA